MKEKEIIPTLPADELPTNWSLDTIGSLVPKGGVFVDGDWVESIDQDPNGDVRLIQLADIGDGIYRNRSERYLTYDKALTLGCTFLQNEDVLIARMPEPLGRACIFPGDSKKSVTVVDVCIIRPNRADVNNRWLMYFINAPAFRTAVASLQSGSTRKRISRSNLAKIQLPIPPSKDQTRIVAEIEKQFSRLDEAVAGLKRIKANLKRYKAAVLKAAVEGKLSEEWRKAQPNVETGAELLKRILAERKKKWEEKNPGKKYKEPAGPDTSNLPELPKGWVWATVDQLASPEPDSITDGPFGSNLKTAHYTSAGPRVIRLQNIGDGIFVDEPAHISEDHFSFLKKHQVLPGDLVIAALGESPPRACVVPSVVGPAIVKADCIRFRSHATLSNLYLNFALNSKPTRERTKGLIHGVGRPRLNLGEIKMITVPLPPQAEQASIVAEVEQLLSVAEEIDATVEANLKRAEHLRQAILEKAFSGNLVSKGAEHYVKDLAELPMAAEPATPYGSSK